MFFYVCYRKLYFRGGIRASIAAVSSSPPDLDAEQCRRRDGAPTEIVTSRTLADVLRYPSAFLRHDAHRPPLPTGWRNRDDLKLDLRKREIQLALLERTCCTSTPAGLLRSGMRLVAARGVPPERHGVREAGIPYSVPELP